MAPPSWLSKDQQEFTLTYHEQYLECKKKGNFMSFWPPFFETWEEKWPARISVLKDVPLDQDLTEPQLEEVAKARDTIHKVFIIKLIHVYISLTFCSD